MAKEKSKILLIEEDKFYRRAYGDGLRNAGFEVLLAQDAKEGIRKMKADKPDLVLLDLLLPVESGFEVLEELKMDDELKEIPVIILSNLSQDSDVRQGKELGAVEYLIKADFTMKEVIGKVKEHIARRRK